MANGHLFGFNFRFSPNDEEFDEMTVEVVRLLRFIAEQIESKGLGNGRGDVLDEQGVRIGGFEFRG